MCSGVASSAASCVPSIMAAVAGSSGRRTSSGRLSTADVGRGAGGVRVTCVTPTVFVVSITRSVSSPSSCSAAAAATAAAAARPLRLAGAGEFAFAHFCCASASASRATLDRVMSRPLMFTTTRAGTGVCVWTRQPFRRMQLQYLTPHLPTFSHVACPFWHVVSPQLWHGASPLRVVTRALPRCQPVPCETLTLAAISARSVSKVHLSVPELRSSCSVISSCRRSRYVRSLDSRTLSGTFEMRKGTRSNAAASRAGSMATSLRSSPTSRSTCSSDLPGRT